MPDSRPPVLETAAEHLVSRLPTARAEETVGTVLTRLIGGAFDAAETVYIVDEAGRLRGLVGLPHLWLASPQQPPTRRAHDRLPWLLGSMVATVVMAGFEQLLATRVTIAFFVPGIVYLADAIRTQTEAIAVRGLSLSHASLRSLLLGELRTGRPVDRAGPRRSDLPSRAAGLR